MTALSPSAANEDVSLAGLSEVPATVLVFLGRDISDRVQDDFQRDLQVRGAVEHDLTRKAETVGLDVPLAELVR